MISIAQLTQTLGTAVLAQADGASEAAATTAAQASAGIGLTHYLTVSALVFTLGITIIVVRRNAIAVLTRLLVSISATPGQSSQPTRGSNQLA